MWVIGEYLLGKLVKKASSLSRNSSENSSESRRVYLKIVKIIDTVFQVASSLNFISFIFGSKYPTLVHRVAQIDFV
jgi:Pex2 / Pex12 amino terminal region